MALSDKQRVAFFKLARRAYDTQQPATDFNCWRKEQMVKSGIPDSVKKCSTIVGFDTLMLHFAELAYDSDLVEHYSNNERRLLLHIIEGLSKDLTYITEKITGDDYGYQFDQAFQYSPLSAMRNIMQSMGVLVSDLCHKHGINTGYLPTAAIPYYFRGKRAADFNSYIKGGAEQP